jgi:Protein of unknown function (DUF3303)
MGSAQGNGLGVTGGRACHPAVCQRPTVFAPDGTGPQPGSTLGWHLIEASDLTLIAQHVAEWSDVLVCDVYPVIEDAEAGAAAQAVFGK